MPSLTESLDGELFAAPEFSRVYVAHIDGETVRLSQVDGEHETELELQDFRARRRDGKLEHKQVEAEG